MFSGGAFIIMAGILRCALIIADPINGAQQAGSWACRETFVAVIIGNIPMIYPLFARAVKIASTSVFSASNSKNASSLKRSNGTSSAAMGGHMELEDRDENGRKSKPKRRGPMSIPGLTTIGNDEEAGNFTQMGKGDSAEHIMALETNYTVDRQNKDRTQTFTSNKTGDMDNTEYYSSHPPAPPHSPLASTYPSQPARKVNSIPVGVTVETHIDISTSENNGDGNPPVSPVSIYAPGRPSVDHGTSTSGPPSRGLPSTGYGGYSAKVTSSR